MSDTPLISVIIPVYNIMEYLPRCVRSVTAQTYTSLEILLVDDGSTDSTGALCDELAREDARIRVFHKPNGGSSSARNLGLTEARGEYIGFVDSDDYVELDMVERLYEGICQYHVRMAQIGRDEIDAEGNPLPNICEPPAEPTLYTCEEFLRELLMHRGDCSFCTKLIHRSLFESETSGVLRFPEGALNEDFHLLIRMLPGTGSLVSLPGQKYHVFYRVGSNSRRAEREDFSRVFGDCVDNADLAEQIVLRDYPELTDVALRFGVYQRLEYLLHIPISRMNRGTPQYREVVQWLRGRWLCSMKNPILTPKNKLYHTLFVIAPKGIRVLHRALGRAG